RTGRSGWKTRSIPIPTCRTLARTSPRGSVSTGSEPACAHRTTPIRPEAAVPRQIGFYLRARHQVRDDKQLLHSVGSGKRVVEGSGWGHADGGVLSGSRRAVAGF